MPVVDQIRTIQVAVDESQPSAWALTQAVQLAQQLNARITLVHVVFSPSTSSSESALAEALGGPALEARGAKVLSQAAEHVPAELLAGSVLREGDAAEEILQAADDAGADLIVMGTHGRGAIARALLGSTAEAVVRHANCPVLTVAQQTRIRQRELN